MKRIVLGMTGATGAVLGIELLRQLQGCADVETHLVLSRWARATIHLETELSAGDVESLADVVYSWDEQTAAISSGSFRLDGMVIAPCSMKTLAAIRMGYADGLIARAADVTLKENRRLVLVPRETPLSQIHLENMLALARMGASIVPPMPAFYNHPSSVGDIVDHIVTRILDQFDIESPTAKRWTGVVRREGREFEGGESLMPRIRDLRDYLRVLESLGDVEHIDRPVSAVLEAAAITRRSTEQGRPAPLFDNVEGAKPGFRLLGAPGALSSDRRHPLARVALSLGLSHDVSAHDLVEHLAAVHGKAPIPPKLVSADSAPCKQNILLGADATLDRFPIPQIHPDDGGRYLNTWGVIVARTPDGRWTNWSISRIMMINNRQMTGLVFASAAYRDDLGGVGKDR